MSERALVFRPRVVIICVDAGLPQQKMASEREDAAGGPYEAISGLLSAHGCLLPAHHGIWDADHLVRRPQSSNEVHVTEVASLIRTLIVDDEPVARSVLREQLEPFPNIEIVGEAANGREALQKIGKLKPDLVFLDLQMPMMSGLEVARGLGGTSLPVIVIVTAFDQHAIQAFEAGAVDYLLKPVSEARLVKALQRAEGLLNRPVEIAEYVAKISAVSTPSSPSKTRKIVGKSGAEYILLDADEVLAFQAERELVWIITSKQRLLATQSLRSIEKRLGEPQFQRVHRNAIVNVNQVRKMSSLSSQRWLITLSNSLQLVVSKRQAYKIRQILQG